MVTSLRHSASQKLLHRERSVEELAQWPFFRSTRVVLDISEVCNQQCIFCDNRIKLLESGRHPREWDLKQFEAVLPKLVKYGTIIFAGAAGEPLLNKDLPTMLQRIKQLRKSCRTEIFTNGVTLTPVVIEEILPWVDSIRLSMCATTSKTQNRLVKHSNFSRILLNLICLDELKPKHLSSHINFIGMVSNIDELPNAVRIASIYNMDGVFLQTLSERGEPSVQGQCLVRQSELLRKYWKAAEEVAKRVGVSLTVGGAYKTVIENQAAEPEVLFDDDGEPVDWVLRQGNKVPGVRETRDCIMPFVNAIVDHTGNIAPCCSRTWKRTDSLNVFRQVNESIEQIGQFVAVRRGLLTGELPDACVQCKRAPVIGIEEFIEKMILEYNQRWLSEHFLTRYALNHFSKRVVEE